LPISAHSASHICERRAVLCLSRDSGQITLSPPRGLTCMKKSTRFRQLNLEGTCESPGGFACAPSLWAHRQSGRRGVCPGARKRSRRSRRRELARHRRSLAAHARRIQAGKLRREEGYEIQLCAQGICLEEMLETVVPTGAVFYGKSRRRLEVPFDAHLRGETAAAAARLHELLLEGVKPVTNPGPKCPRCSLADLCTPKVLAETRSAKRYLSAALKESEDEAM